MHFGVLRTVSRQICVDQREGSFAVSSATVPVLPAFRRKDSKGRWLNTTYNHGQSAGKPRARDPKHLLRLAPPIPPGPCCLSIFVCVWFEHNLNVSSQIIEETEGKGRNEHGRLTGGTVSITGRGRHNRQALH